MVIPSFLVLLYDFSIKARLSQEGEDDFKEICIIKKLLTDSSKSRTARGKRKEKWPEMCALLLKKKTEKKKLDRNSTLVGQKSGPQLPLGSRKETAKDRVLQKVAKVSERANAHAPCLCLFKHSMGWPHSTTLSCPLYPYPSVMRELQKFLFAFC